MKNYSQYDEQTHILKAFEGRPVGGFLDIGAYNPTELSNTRALYELGWRGVMVEPSPGPMCSLLREYGQSERITLIQAIVTCTCPVYSLVPFRATDDAVSTTDVMHYMRWKERAKFLGSLLVGSVPLVTVRDTFDPFDFIDIDTEGSSADLFIHAVKALEMRPRCFCVEHDGRKMELCEVANAAGYRLDYDNETNLVFSIHEAFMGI